LIRIGNYCVFTPKYFKCGSEFFLFVSRLFILRRTKEELFYNHFYGNTPRQIHVKISKCFCQGSFKMIQKNSTRGTKIFPSENFEPQGAQI
jgi:hypothetical protein